MILRLMRVLWHAWDTLCKESLRDPRLNVDLEVSLVEDLLVDLPCDTQ